mmetsp:Transcript_6320/g.17903  ORF Transcript_6320/g.17903 Transcript_6320/m.17903 type:complete len:81 (-) Transcript_6320:82-324(-)
MLDRLKEDGMRDLREIMPRWKPWSPPQLDQGLQQGGMLVFRGPRVRMFHKDAATGAHASLADVVELAASSEPEEAPRPPA